ncbi:MAG: hypothetical protein PWP27_954 [Clostridiales bacterium]|jgi:hypothetical protein|nr:hypothetical protein [Clostridiales bacterium]MDK2933144.1 hypothetical protein [Clostridiales bacterium]
MNIPISLIISFISFLGNNKILEIAKQLDFIARHSKLQPDTIVKVFILANFNSENIMKPLRLAANTNILCLNSLFS